MLRESGVSLEQTMFSVYFPKNMAPINPWSNLLRHAISYMNVEGHGRERPNPLDIAFGLKGELYPLLIGFRIRVFKPDPRNKNKERQRQIEIFNQHARIRRTRLKAMASPSMPRI